MNGSFLIIALVLATGAVGLLLYAAAYRKQASRLQRPAQPIGGAQPGPVKLEGTVDSKELFTSPVSEKRCIYMRIAIHQTGIPIGGAVTASHRSRGQHNMARDGTTGIMESASRGTIHEQKADSLVLCDSSGEVEVDLKDVDFELVQDHAMKTSVLGANDPEVDRILRRFSINTGPGGAGGSFTIHETILEPEDKVIVTGKLAIDGSGLTRVVHDVEEPVFVTDQDVVQLSAGSSRRARWGMFGAMALGLLAAWMLVLSFAGGSSKNPYSAQSSGLSDLNH